MPLSIVILTFNEEANIAACLDTVDWCDDVVVLDSFSSDRTVELARSRPNVRVFQRAFDSFAGQRNHAMREIAFKHRWLFHLDADERFTEGLRRECEAVACADAFSGFFVPSKLIYRGKWLRRAATYPAYQMRFVKIGEMSFVQKGHGQREGELARGFELMREPYLHYNFAKGLEDWLDKHNRYSTQEARETISELESGQLDLGYLVRQDPLLRRRTLKKISYRLPARPIVKFFYMFFFKLGFLDGRAGLEYCILQAIYEYMIALKVRELREGRAIAAATMPAAEVALPQSDHD